MTEAFDVNNGLVFLLNFFTSISSSSQKNLRVKLYVFHFIA